MLFPRSLTATWQRFARSAVHIGQRLGVASSRLMMRRLCIPKIITRGQDVEACLYRKALQLIQYRNFLALPGLSLLGRPGRLWGLTSDYIGGGQTFLCWHLRGRSGRVAKIFYGFHLEYGVSNMKSCCSQPLSWYEWLEKCRSVVVVHLTLEQQGIESTGVKALASKSFIIILRPLEVIAMMRFRQCVGTPQFSDRHKTLRRPCC